MNIQLFAGEERSVLVYSNNGETLLDNRGLMTSGTLIVTSTGYSYNNSPEYIYSGSSSFLGFAKSPNAIEPDYSAGDTIDWYDPDYGYGNVVLYIIIGGIYKHILKDGYKIQVEAAIRDDAGVKISTNYAKKSELDGVSATDVSLEEIGEITLIFRSSYDPISFEVNENETWAEFIQNNPNEGFSISSGNVLYNSNSLYLSDSYNNSSVVSSSSLIGSQNAYYVYISSEPGGGGYWG